jgi:hypothetical protein
MTTIRKPYYRITSGAYSVLHHRSFRQIVVGLEPGDVLTFREKGRRRKFSFPIESAFRQSIKITVEAKRRLSRGRRAA